MRELYATTMQVVHLAGGDAFNVARERALQWAWRVEGSLPDLDERPHGQEPEAPGTGDTVVNWWSSQGATARAVEIRLTHPDGDDPTMQWRSTIIVSEIDQMTRVTLRLQRGATVHVLRPGRMELRAPAVVMDFMRPPLMAYAGTLELVPGTKVLQAGEVAGFVADVLTTSGRALPVLVASSDVPASFTDALARALAGLVQVVRDANVDADDALRDALRAQVVPKGGLRLFWPGFGMPEQRALRNPYWTAIQVREGGRGGRSVLDQLVRLLAPVSTDRVPPDPGMMIARRQSLMSVMKRQREREDAQRERARQQRREVQRAARAARQAMAGHELPSLYERVEELEDLLQLAEEERDSATKRAQDAAANELRIIEESDELLTRAASLGTEIAQLKAENDNLRDNIRAINEFDHGSDAAEVEERGDEVTENVTSWEEIAAQLEDLEGPGFRLTERAKECANGKSRYPRPDVMWRALRALERVGRTYNEMGAKIGKRFDEFASEVAGIEVAMQDHIYDDDSWFEYDDCWYQRLPHVKVDDAKSPNEVGRIYFGLDGEGQRLIVDWFGTKPDRPRTRRPATARAA
jgi:hypothetical protein